jgi:hypothetical protein
MDEDVAGSRLEHDQERPKYVKSISLMKSVTRTRSSVAKKLAHLDINGDGVIDEDELVAAVEVRI